MGVINGVTGFREAIDGIIQNQNLAGLFLLTSTTLPCVQ